MAAKSNKEKGFEKHRTYRKIDSIPQEIRDALDDMLSDASLSYAEITKWLNEELQKSKIDVEISRSAVGRYAFRTKQLSARYQETMEYVKEIVRLAKENPDENLNEGALQMGMLKLAEKLATADFDNISEAKALELVARISRTKAYKDKVYAGLKNEYEKGYEKFLRRVTAELEAYPQLIEQLKAIAKETLGKMIL